MKILASSSVSKKLLAQVTVDIDFSNYQSYVIFCIMCRISMVSQINVGKHFLCLVTSDAANSGLVIKISFQQP